LNVPLLKPCAKDVFFKALIVYMAYGNLEDANIKYKTFINEDPTMLETREDQFLKASLAALAEKNLDSFQQACSKFKAFTDFDKWKLTMFAQITNKLNKVETGEGFID